MLPGECIESAYQIHIVADSSLLLYLNADEISCFCLGYYIIVDLH